MKNFIQCFLILIIFNNCTKEFDYQPTTNAVTTLNILETTKISATISGEVKEDNGASVQEKGICYSIKTTYPTDKDSKSVANTNGLGAFNCKLSNLSPSTLYYARAYARNSYGTAYGEVLSFTTKDATLALLSTTTPAAITQTTALTGGTITDDGAAAITQRGVCFSDSNQQPTIADNKTSNGTGKGTFNSQLTGLKASVKYYVRAYATNSVGTVYGAVKTFTTLNPVVPTGILTYNVTNYSNSTANLNGTVTGDGGSPIISKGICYSKTNANPTKSDNFLLNEIGLGNITITPYNLTGNTKYYARAFATNAAGTAYGNVVSFTTKFDHYVGESYQCGKVACVYQQGEPGFVAGETHGFIVSLFDIGTSANWGCSGTNVAGTSILLGTGQSNTNKILATCPVPYIAAKVCDDYVYGGYSDWYLPSYYELNKIYTNRSSINLGFSSTAYWTSTQSGSGTANTINLSTGLITSTFKGSSLKVRAIRSF
jgi:hypothetical protein